MKIYDISVGFVVAGAAYSKVTEASAALVAPKAAATVRRAARVAGKFNEARGTRTWVGK